MNKKQSISNDTDIHTKLANLNRKFEIDGALNKVLLGSC